MEANLFRFYAQKLGDYLVGKRIEKIYQPVKGVWNIKLSSRQFLLLIISAKAGCLFLSSAKPENPSEPSSQVGWWRKRLVNKYIQSIALNWPDREIAFQIGPELNFWLLMDLRSGLKLEPELPDRFYKTPKWPSLIAIFQTKQIYRDYPQISPPLRKTLNNLQPEEAEKIYRFLQSEEFPSHFYLYLDQNKDPRSFLPWPLPEHLASDFKLEIYEDIFQAVNDYGWFLLSRLLSPAGKEEEFKNRQIKKIEKRLARTQEDKKRLQEMTYQKETARLIQANLYRFEPKEKVKQITVAKEDGSKQVLDLQPDLTILQNMEKAFKIGQKGERGLEIVRQRETKLKQELDSLKSGKSSWKFFPASDQKKVSQEVDKKQIFPKLQGLQVHIFRSSDGFLILRGKNQKSNHKLLSQATKPFDYWFHAADGPGAHVVLRRDYSEQKVPRKSLEEAAVLAALSSYQSLEETGKVIQAQVKDVRKVKGSALGQVQVDKVRETMRIRLDKGLEDRLKVS